MARNPTVASSVQLKLTPGSYVMTPVSCLMDYSDYRAPNGGLPSSDKLAQAKFAAFLPPHYQVSFAWYERPVYYGQITIDNAVAMPLMSADPEKIGATRVPDKQLIEAQWSARSLGGRVGKAGVHANVCTGF